MSVGELTGRQMTEGLVRPIMTATVSRRMQGIQNPLERREFDGVQAPTAESVSMSTLWQVWRAYILYVLLAVPHRNDIDLNYDSCALHQRYYESTTALRHSETLASPFQQPNNNVANKRQCDGDRPWYWLSMACC
jgi:hypothetical protein